MLSSKKTGFTLVELLVVMSIIGILAAALTTQITKARDTSRAVRCKANLRNLGQAALNYGVDNGILPWAGSHEWVYSSRNGNSYKTTVGLRRGWVDWTKSDGSQEFWPKDYSGGGASSCGKGAMVTAIVGIPGYMSVTNGTLWSYMGRDLSAYICDAHVTQYRSTLASKKDMIYRSYFMNGYFGYNKDYLPVTLHRDIYLNSLSASGSAASLLMFAELPIKQDGIDAKAAVDGVLESVIVGYNDGRDTPSVPAREILGFNHLVGKQYVAHLVYADGHVDAISVGVAGLKANQMKGLAYFLCNGYEVPKDSANWLIP